MDEPYLGEIRPVALNFAPRGWALCNGQLLPIAQNQALFSLLGTMYGGNGVNTFALPDLRSRVPVGMGLSSSGSNYTQGQTLGSEGVTVTAAQLPAHAHSLSGTLKTASEAIEANPAGQYPAVGNLTQYSAGPTNTNMAGNVTGTTAPAGGSQPHENRMPYQGINYVIALTGIFPSRS